METITKKSCGILIIEDNPLLLEAYKSALEEEGFIVHTTSNGSTSIELTKQIKPDGIILDLSIHGTNGLVVLAELKNNPETQTIPIIILTSSSNPKDRTDAEALMVNRFYNKSDTSLKNLVTYVKEITGSE